MPPAAAIGGAAVIGAGGGIAGAAIQANAARHAADTQADAARYAADLQYQMYEQQRADQQPWREAGSDALAQMQNPYFQKNFTMADFQADPGYQFRMDQGLKALQASAAARGGLMSGNTLKGITDYGQNFASNEYQNAYNRFNNDQSTRFNRLASLAGIGQTANSQLAQAGMNYGNQAGEAMMGGANAAAAGMIGSANAWGGALSNIGNNLGNNWMQMSMMNRMMPGQSNSVQPLQTTGSIGQLGSTDLPYDGSISGNMIS